MKKLLFFTVLVVVAAASAVYSLSLLDGIVHGMLYSYGLQFSYDWANPYWMMLRFVQVFIGLSAVFSVVGSVYAYKRFIYVKPHVTVSKGEKKVAPARAVEPEPQSESQRVGGLVKCTHCQKVFAQPLRMLDFHSDRPRIVNICPFCNEVIAPVLRRDEELDKGKRGFLKGRRDNHVERKDEGKKAEEAVETKV